MRLELLSITFAIPYYSNQAYLVEAIRSVQAQTRTDWQLIIVDDAGPEPVDALITQLGDDRISTVRNPVNLGLAGNWNECIRLATTPWVTLLHADDRLAPRYAEAVLSAAGRDPALAAIFTDTDIIGADGRAARSLPETVKRFANRPKHDHDVGGDDGLASILANNYVMCPTLCYRTELALTHPFDGRWRQVLDLDHTAQMLLRDQRLHGIRQPLYQYRRHSANLTASQTASAVRFEEEIALYRELEVVAADKGWKRSARTARRRAMVRTHLALQTVIDLGSGRVGAARNKAGLLISDLRRRSDESHRTGSMRTGQSR